MGLLIKLQNGDTQLKSLKFGKDRPGGGDSGQPYIQNNINGPSQNPDYYNDFVLRGGIEAPISAAEDVSRLTQYLASPKGLLFITKQQLLSRIGTKTEASRGAQYLWGGLNEGTYNPLGTLAQAGTGFLGAHFDKQLGRNYQEVISQNQPKDNFNPDLNRLTQLTKLISTNRAESDFARVKGYKLNTNNSLISYGGGSDSNLGVGKTSINFATSNYGDPDSIKTLLPKEEGYLIPNKDYYIPSGSVYQTGLLLEKNPDKTFGGVVDFNPLIKRSDLKKYLVGRPFNHKSEDGKWQRPFGASIIYSNITTVNVEPNFENFFDYVKGNYSWENAFFPSIYESSGSLTPIKNYKSYLTLQDPNSIKSREEDIPYTRSIINSQIELYYNVTSGKRKFLPRDILVTRPPGTNQIQPVWQFNNEGASTRSLTTFTTLGYRPELDTYHIKKQLPEPILGVNKKYTPYTLERGVGDTVVKLYDSTQIAENINDKEDYVDFIIAVINPTSPETAPDLLKFPAYVKSFSDSYNADWNSQTYMGRAENFYKYNSFSRDINFTFTVAAISKDNLIENYAKLNSLAASLAPTYTSQGYMAGNLHRLTFGNYVKGQYGILESVDYTIMDESPWEVEGNDKLPFYIEVSCRFIPIHNFRPSYNPTAGIYNNLPFIHQTS